LQITAFAGASFYSLGPGLGKRGWKGIFGAKRPVVGTVCRLMAARITARARTFGDGRFGCCGFGLRQNLPNAGASRMQAVPDQIAGTAFNFSAGCRESRAVPGGNLPMPIGHAMLNA
jgi:hypothetical protein